MKDYQHVNEAMIPVMAHLQAKRNEQAHAHKNAMKQDVFYVMQNHTPEFTDILFEQIHGEEGKDLELFHAVDAAAKEWADVVYKALIERCQKRDNNRKKKCYGSTGSY